MVNVPADDAVQPALDAFVGDGFLEIADKVHCTFDLMLQVRRQRPVAIAVFGAPVVQPAVEGQGEFVGRVAQKGQPAVVAGDHIELVAVDDQKAAAIGSYVLGFVHQLDVAQNKLRVTTQELVMVAGDVNHFGAALAHGQQAPNHVGVRLRPVHAAAQFPAVDDVADQVHLVRLITLEKRRQVLGLAVARAQVNVGNPQGPHTLFAAGCGELSTGHVTTSGRVLKRVEHAG
ncbi:hypothetical protein ALP75_201735 [Pseudomonas syringae pv. actinidiae]|nr:hypothetical protein ALP75_201735 [Pseudomonas syringae pv. actinidiae]